VPWSRPQDASIDDDIVLSTGREGQIASIRELSRAGVVAGPEWNFLATTVMALLWAMTTVACCLVTADPSLCRIGSGGGSDRVSWEGTMTTGHCGFSLWSFPPGGSKSRLHVDHAAGRVPLARANSVALTDTS